ncbi:TetR/AcrR family transcriptional regulator [Nicoliella spurrieriana]|uniref:TetR/AcrR family transcriptional regulator n=1 Tax=Nicoliella spurrieriana TaxID=2925830 RepID=A0A976RSN6_9LACO|nr:TetR/AcrR family transcriptional regulator [Nicoliella spurrieriana]UQS87112.1 TetR/AcrR family transcriptional regulator [Nicoliella spurrieriana]
MRVKHDLRIKKTQFAIKHAFWQLIMEQGISNVTTNQIIATAGINRTTFYNHYANQAELLSNVEDDLIAKINQQVSAFPSDTEKWNDYHQRVINAIYKNGAYIKALIDNKDSRFIQKATHQSRIFIREQNLLNQITIPENYVIEGLFGLASTIIYEWVKSDYRETPAEFFKIFEKMIRPILVSNQIITK